MGVGPEPDSEGGGGEGGAGGGGGGGGSVRVEVGEGGEGGGDLGNVVIGGSFVSPSNSLLARSHLQTGPVDGYIGIWFPPFGRGWFGSQ
jgi:hypothetical protein